MHLKDIIEKLKEKESVCEHCHKSWLLRVNNLEQEIKELKEEEKATDMCHSCDELWQLKLWEKDEEIKKLKRELNEYTKLANSLFGKYIIKR